MENKQGVENSIYIQAALLKMRRYWYFFVLSIVSFVGMACFVNWYSQPVYEVGSTILIDGNQNTGSPDPSQEFMKSFSIFSSSSDINKEMKKMKSLELIRQALERKSLDVSYYATTSGIKKIELYDDAPFYVQIIKNHVQPLGVKFWITPKSDNQFGLSIDQTSDEVVYYNYQKSKIVSVGAGFSINKTYQYGDTITSDLYCFIVLTDKRKVQNFQPDFKYSFVFNNLDNLMYSYQKELKVEQVGKDIEAVNITMRVKNPQKGIDFINELTKVYMQRNVDKKNFLAENAIKYIDRELSTIEGALATNESDLQQFRSNNKMMEIKTLSDQAFEVVHNLETQKAELESRARYYDYMYTNLEEEENSSKILVPSSMGVNDQVLSGIIEQYMKLNTERNNLIENKKTLSPYFISLTNKLDAQKKTLLDNLRNLMKTNNVLLTSINNRLKEENVKISLLPGTERGLVGIERKQNLNDEVFKYMLRKKAEAQIAKGSSLPDNDILETAKLTKIDPISPNKPVYILIAFAAGLFFPFAIFGIKSLLNNTITSEQMLLSLVQLPLIGRVYRKKGQKKISALIGSPKSPILESIRTVRTNIEYFSAGKEHQVVLFTSSMSGEGKSFCSLNLANSLALAKRKTVLLDFDLRKPNQYLNFTSENKLGITSFLNGTSALDDIFIPTGVANLDFIGAGEISDTPAELIDSERTALLINKLKEKYDYVIIDTAPVGLVWETFLLMKYSDLKIFVVRENVTLKAGLTTLLKELEGKQVQNMYCLLNDVDMADSYYGKKNEYFSEK